MLEDKKQKITELFELYQGDIQALQNDIQSTFGLANNSQQHDQDIGSRVIDASDIVTLQNVTKQYKLGG